MSVLFMVQLVVLVVAFVVVAVLVLVGYGANICGMKDIQSSMEFHLY